MSNIQLIIEERARNIGNFLVGRLLPFSQKRAIGPFVFIDHMGPKELSENENLDIPPHPHIGLSTLTYLFDGAVLHRDSIGNEIEILPGEVNWMTAGKGVVHSERTPERLRNKAFKMHGLQIWVAMPKALENSSPSFTHHQKEDLPAWREGELQFKLIAGEAFGRKSPVPVHSALYFIEIKNSAKSPVNIGHKLYGENGIYILEGAVISNNERFEPKQLLVAQKDMLCNFELEANSTIYIFGGEPFSEERFIEWNFVSSSKQTIEEAKLNWLNQNFDPVQNETDFVPLPQN